MSKLKTLKESRATIFSQIDELRTAADGCEMTSEEESRWQQLLAGYERADQAVEADVRDEYNDRSQELTYVATCYAQRTESGGRENLYAGRIVHENEVVYTIRYREGLRAGMVVSDNGQQRKITSIHAEGRRWRLHLKTTKSDAEN